MDQIHTQTHTNTHTHARIDLRTACQAILAHPNILTIKLITVVLQVRSGWIGLDWVGLGWIGLD